MFFAKWYSIFGLLVVATGITNLAACADVVNPEVDEHSLAFLMCESAIDTADGEVGLIATADGEVGLFSCQFGTPVDEQGFQSGEGEFGIDACISFYGPCTGATGLCSWVTAGGFTAWSCLPFTYAVLVLCDGYPSYLVNAC
jgi:hypothetical protein